MHSQITEMRFSLTLLLHQLEQTLKESFGMMLLEAQPTANTSPQGREMEAAVTHTKQMGQAEAHHRAQVENYKVLFSLDPNP